MTGDGWKALYSGNFNDMLQEKQPDGTVIITLSKRGEKSYRLRVKNLYKENEEVLEDKEIEAEQEVPQFIKDRQKLAKGVKNGRG